MTGRVRARACVSVAIFAACLPGASVYAALGGNRADIATEAAELPGTVLSEPRPAYDLLEIITDTGIRVREYVNRGGIVFAVSWQAPVQPDLRRLLGAYFGTYAEALAALDHPGLHRSIRIMSPNLQVESGGHLRAYSGRAFLPGMIPAGVPVTELR
jgi:hypothetical protein